MAAILPQTAAAQSDQAGQINIAVTDAASKVPLDLARVLLNGPVITTEFTGKDGLVHFVDVPDGIYRARVVKRGYDAVSSAQFEVLEGKAITVSVALAESQNLQVIATVTVKSTATISTNSISNDSAQRKLSNDLADALNKLSGVTVSTSSDDSDATETVSLEGHDASQTQLTLDGIPLNAPGTAGNLNQFATDLFSGASVNQGPQIGGLGGGVNFRTIEPTLSWQSTDSLSAGSKGKYNWSVGESGSAGELGIAAQAVYRSIPSLVDGLTYEDASGLDYNHDGDASTSGQIVKLRYRLNDAQTLTGEFLNSARQSNLVCLRESGVLPCGYGPGNTSDLNSQLYSLTDNALVGDTTIQASIYGSTFRSNRDLLERFVNGEAQPTGFDVTSKNVGYTLSAELPAKERHTLSIQAYGTNSRTTTTPLVAQAAPFYNGTQSTSYSALQLVDKIQSNTHLTLNETFGLGQASNAPASLLASVGLNWQATKVDTYAASYAIGGAAAHPGRSNILSDPQSITFDCNGGIGYGSAPGDQPGASSSTSERASYTHQWRNGLLSGTLYRQVQNDVVLPTQVNGSILANPLTPYVIFPPDYFNEINGIFNSNAGCGVGANPNFGPPNMYFTTPVGGVRRVYEGASITGYMTFGGLVVQPYYDITVSKAVTNDPRIANPLSIVIPGSQLPNVPLHRAGLTFDYKAPRSTFEYLADAQYVSANNPNNLPAYTTFDAGVSEALARGSLTFAMSNITNRFGGIFASPVNAVPYQTAGGRVIPTLARPLAPRQVSVTYTLRFGQSVRSNVSPSLPRSGGPGPGGPEFYGGPGSAPGPGGPGAPGGSGGGGFRAMLSPIPNTPPADPLAVNAAGSQCTSDNAKTAHAMLDPLKAYVAQIEDAKTLSGYPASMPAPDIAGLGVTYHGLGSSYALTLVVKSGLRQLFPCMAVHLAQGTDAQDHHLYQAQSSAFFVPQLTFMPRAGLYVAPRPPQAGQESFRLYKLPTTPPPKPFAVFAGPNCTNDFKATAAQLLAQLQAHFGAGSAVTPGWQIVPHTAKSGTYYELNVADLSALPAVLSCARVAAASKDDLTKAGWDGVRPTALNYAPALGLYLLRGGLGAGGGAPTTQGAAQSTPSPGGVPAPTPRP